MNYKKVFQSEQLRMRLLGLTEFIPDKTMIYLQYWIKTGRKLNLSNPKRFNEKIQWYKLYYRDPLMAQCADKYEVREYVTSKNLEEILIPLYGVYDDANDIDFNKLPSKFILKTNNGSHTNIICEDKSTLNIENTRKVLNTWLTKRTAKAGREWAYYNINPKIICEKLLDKDKNNDLIDYKFYCFNGKCSYIKVATNTSSGNPENGIFNMEFEQLPYCRSEVVKITDKIEKPKNYKNMCKIAEALSSDFPHVRVDLYNINGKIYFGELTFYDTSGYQIFEPDEFDYILGNLFSINKIVQ
ncbi:ATP-grasp fold amidoligase family protein [Halobacillus halophilus]|uniref:ATP-grasp fold amidoligase family protein n=1 Tax=Halobacillus halophilus TaxID=1570 RepID=UPI001CD69DA4|nr:ATP-grasp fold amidoligase family protein [Halobacillus halophilus]MCA1010727.1 hypothetical protein [Halobacillus halophilus]